MKCSFQMRQAINKINVLHIGFWDWDPHNDSMELIHCSEIPYDLQKETGQLKVGFWYTYIGMYMIRSWDPHH